MSDESLRPAAEPLFPVTKTTTRVLKPVENAYEWPLGASLIWLVWRDVARANTEWASSLENREIGWVAGDLANATCEPTEAESLLLDGLRSGDVRAFGRVSEDEYEDRVPIEPYRWSFLLLENGFPQPPDGFFSVLLLASDVKRLSESTRLTNPAFSPKSPRSKATKMGRPMKYDWATAAGVMVDFIVQNDPNSRAEVVRELLRWFENRQQFPDRGDVEKFVEAAMPKSR